MFCESGRQCPDNVITSSEWPDGFDLLDFGGIALSVTSPETGQTLRKSESNLLSAFTRREGTPGTRTLFLHCSESDL
jgi:hypothetical protein